MKNLFTILLILTAPLYLFAQKNFYKFSIGVGAGLTENRGDLSSSQARKLYLANADYYLNPFIHGGVEVQVGNMSGIDNSNNRYFTNNFKAVTATGKLHLGQFLDKYRGAVFTKTNFEKAAEGIFAGLGAGVIQVNQTEIYRQRGNQLTQGANSNKEIFLPFSLGIDNTSFNSRIVAGIRYQYNFVLGDQLDGYSRAGSRNDIYSTFTMSVKYKFGSMGIY